MAKFYMVRNVGKRLSLEAPLPMHQLELASDIVKQLLQDIGHLYHQVIILQVLHIQGLEIQQILHPEKQHLISSKIGLINCLIGQRSN